MSAQVKLEQLILGSLHIWNTLLPLVMESLGLLKNGHV